MTDNLSPEAFLRAFDEDTGTAPQVVGLLSLESVRLSEAVDVKAPGTIAVAAEEYLAPAAKMPVDVVATLSDSAPRSESLQSMASGSTWTPRDAHIRVEESSVWANVVEIKQTYQWFGLNPFNAPHVIPDHWGAEFGVDLTTELPQYQVGSRPNCWPGYEEAPAARNDNFTFWVMVTDGTEYLGNPGPAGFYGDYFDALDSCARNSITVGAADPGAIPSDPYGTQWISITILADRGNDEVSRVSGNVQALERYSCEASPSTPLTVCMGLDTDLPWPGPGAQSQLTKNETTVWYAPDRCWYTPEFGSAAYDMGCEGGPGHGR